MKGLKCVVCDSALPDNSRRNAKYCSQKCSNIATAAKNPYGERFQADKSIDTFGFLTRKGLAQSSLQ